MVAVSGVIVFAGYQLIAYGWSQLQGQNAGFFDLLWPGRYKGSTPDKAADSTSPVPSTPSAYPLYPSGVAGSTTILGK